MIVALGLNRIREKDCGPFLSSPERPVVSLWAGFLAQAFSTRRAFPPLTFVQDSGLIAAFVAVTVAGPRRIYTGLPYETQNRDFDSL
jgi:hypothetical protein